jgi:CheY-like chemotaxis protein
MPVMDGFEATKRIRDVEKNMGKKTPVIAMTAFAMKSDKDKCIEAGMDDYISKPVDMNKLKEALEKWTNIDKTN